MANINDVAKLAGVSTATVSAVLNGQDIVKLQTRRRVMDAITKLNYHPNLYARSLARGRSALLGLIISDITNPFFADVAQVVQAEAKRCGYQVFISATQFSLELLKAAVKYMIGMRVDGLLGHDH
jgi:DNA-binding LacI/PurR family transcriptional regulator